MSTEEQLAIQREMGFTDWESSCQDVHITPEGVLRECRRQHNHTGPHASGYNIFFIAWRDAE